MTIGEFKLWLELNNISDEAEMTLLTEDGIDPVLNADAGYESTESVVFS